jgi:hypothetical protein
MFIIVPTKEQPQCRTPPRLRRTITADSAISREPLADVVAWAGLLDKIIEHDLSRYPEMSKRELSRLAEEFEHVNDELKEAVNRMDSIYHEREEEEAPQ